MTTAHAAIDPTLLDHSRSLIRTLQEPNGAYPASPAFSAYRGYCWFRDGAFIADGMSAAGEAKSATAFFDWCAMVVRRYSPDIERAIAAAAAGTPLPDEQMLPARFTFAGARGDGDDWWDFQLDGFGTWLWALRAHAARHGLNLTEYADAVELTARYLIASWERPCYDWWEEHSEEVHVSTLGCIGAGLEACAEMDLLDADLAEAARREAGRIREAVLTRGVADGHLIKWFGNDAVDGSLAALIAPLGFIAPDHPVAAATLAAIERDLAVDHGVHRFLGDTFYGGGQWPLLSCFLGLAHAARGDHAAARDLLAWAGAQATADRDLPEQVPHHLLAPERRDEWVDRWGTVATPLLWSHAMVLRLATEVAS